jgi:hypothetical protein
MGEIIKLVLDEFGIDWDYSWVTEKKLWTLKQNAHQLTESGTY